jgi:hypothetical protein
VACLPILPNEAQPVAIVYSNAVLPGAVLSQCLQGVSRRPKIMETPGRVKLEQFANRNFLDGLELLGSDPTKDLFGFGISKGTNHRLYCISVSGKLSNVGVLFGCGFLIMVRYPRRALRLRPAF